MTLYMVFLYKKREKSQTILGILLKHGIYQIILCISGNA